MTREHRKIAPKALIDLKEHIQSDYDSCLNLIPLTHCRCWTTILLPGARLVVLNRGDDYEIQDIILLNLAMPASIDPTSSSDLPSISMSSATAVTCIRDIFVWACGEYTFAWRRHWTSFLLVEKATQRL